MKGLSQKLKRALLVTLAVAMLVPIPAQTGLAATQKQKALNAYKKWLSKDIVLVDDKGGSYLGDHGKANYYYKGSKSSDLRFSLIYVDNDNIPELAVYDSYLLKGCILTYKKGKIVRFGSSYVPTHYYKKKGTLKFTDRRVTKYGYEIVSKVSGKYKGVLSLYQEKTGNGGNKFYDISKAKSRVEIDKKAFNSRMKKYTKRAKATKIKYYKNTKANRNKRKIIAFG